QTGELALRREGQAVDWMWTLVRERLEQRARQHPDLASIEAAVRRGELSVEAAASRLMGF
ncbi:MAG TPA: methylmalonyl Co-A mutase-associated GTPase MeaB, partial [Myxococcota bacterium]|nr:methylmalonyl Co-A mutase-associated GTPase MeaB [Myxococcota bacterium]